ncbi:MAG: endoribonuclease [Bacteriovoracaceae bacterium]|nr:endoribonuclease [Bacteriovoracaceae bacterium]
MKEISKISTDQAPQALGPYSQAVKVGDFLFCCGQIPIDPSNQQVITGDIKVQTERVCLNIKAVLEKAGLDFSRVVKSTCYLKDMNQFTAFNEVYEKFLGISKPARTTIEVARLPKDVSVEIEVIAAF